MCIFSQPFGRVLRYSYVTAPKTGKVELVKTDTMEDFIEALIPIAICVVLPVLIVWLIGRVKQNETNRKAEIMLKALDNGAQIDADFFKSQSGSKTIKERLLGRLTGACVTSLLGIALTVSGLFFWFDAYDKMGEPGIFLVLAVIGGVLLAVGITLFIIYFTSKKMLAKEIAAEEKQLTEGK